MSPEETFKVLASAVAGIQDPLLRAALAQDLFGRSGMDLLPMLAEGADALQKTIDKARELGIVFSDEDAAAADALGDSFTNVKKSIEGVQIEIGKLLSGPLKTLIDQITNTITAMTKWAEANPETASTLLNVAAAIGLIFVTLGPLLVMLPMIVAGITLLLGPIGLIILAIGAWTVAIVELGMWWGNIIRGIKYNFELMVNDVIRLINKLIDALNLIPGVNIGNLGEVGTAQLSERAKSVLKKNAIPFAAGGIVTRPTLAMVGEAGPEAVMPLGRLGGGGAGSTYNFNFPNYVGDKSELISIVREGLYELKASNGALGFD